jgi:threonine dehydrogenase-like Zn-dependent dehydrogenase
MIGAGPTGLVLAQLLKLNGGCHVTLAANAGIKMELAQKLEAADEYIFLDRKTPEKQWEQIKTDNPYVSMSLILYADFRDLILWLRLLEVPRFLKMPFTM